MTCYPILRVCSIGKSGFRFWNPDFEFAIEREIHKRISTLRNLFLDFLFTVRLANPKRDLKLTVPKNSGLARALTISKKKTAVYENSFANRFSFRFPNRTVRRKSMKSGFGFLNWNLPWGRISRRWNPKSGFQNVNPGFGRQAPRKLSLCRRGSLKRFE